MTDFSTITPQQWTLHDAEIASLLSVSTRTVKRERERRGLPPGSRRTPGRPPGSIAFDPSETNQQNAERLGVTVQWAAKLRKQHTEDWL